jgi:CRISPR/Cas system-associated exonuclease Cas4 (RecB family)
MKLSPSALKTWMSCPLQARFKEVEQRPSKINAKTTYGTCMHDALEFYNLSGDITETINRFKATWKDPSLLNAVPDWWPKNTTYGDLLKKGIATLESYHKKNVWDKRDIIAAEHKFCVPIGDHLLNGIVDLIEARPLGKHTELSIIDYKAQPLYSKILTPQGWTTMGKLSVGDEVIGSNGKPTKVVGVFPQGATDNYRVHFRDGTYTECSGEHYWTVRKLGSEDWQVLRLVDFKDNLQYSEKTNWLWETPVCEPVEFEAIELPIHPYILGIFISEGSGTHDGAQFTSASSEVVSRVSNLLPDHLELRSNGLNHRICNPNNSKDNTIAKALSELGLKVGALEKFIPHVYLFSSSVEDRKELLAGLMDGDGSASNRTQYRTSSARLAKDFMTLCRSLGGVPRCGKPFKSWYPDTDGNRRYCSESYHLSPCVPFNPFSIQTKSDRWKAPKYKLTRRIVKVERVPDTQTQCIKVSNQDGLYITDDFIVTHNTAGKRPYGDDLRLDVQFCADTETEILTKRGWVSFDSLLEGEEVLTLNTETGLAEWQPTLGVHIFETRDQDLISIESLGHSSLTTANHRWPVRHVVSSKNGWRYEDRIVTSENLTQSDSILCAAPVTNLPLEQKYLDALVEIIGWYWTEGHQIKGGSISFAQSEAINPINVLRIRKALTTLFGPASDSLRSSIDVAWRESKDPDVNRFYLNRMASEFIGVHFSDLQRKIIDPNFISSLTESQLHLFIDVSFMADGTEVNGCRVITQSDNDRLDAIQMACSLVGFRTSIRERKIGGSGKYAGRPYWILSIKDRRSWYSIRKKNMDTVKYTGKVWCPRTENQTWYARRHGQVYFTGNTAYYYASLQPEFWIGYNEDYPGMENGLDLYYEFLDSPRKVIWYHLMDNKEINAGPRDDDDFGRLYRCIDSVAEAIEKNVFVPNISGSSCIWCDYQDICPVQIPSYVEASIRINTERKA